MNRQTFNAMVAQYAVQEASGEGAVSWDNGVRCVLPEVLVHGKAVQNGTPTPDAPVMPEFSSGTEVVSRGKNLFDADAFFEFFTTLPLKHPGNEMQRVAEDGRKCFWFNPRSGQIADDSELPKDSGGMAIMPLNLKPNTRYTLRFIGKQEAAAEKFATGLALRYEDGTITSAHVALSTDWTEVVATASSDKTVVGLRLTYNELANAYIDIDSIQIEEGATATPYVPYFDGGSATAPELLAIPGTNIRDEWNPQTGKGVRRVGKLVLDGTEGWEVYGSGGIAYSVVVSGFDGVLTLPYPKCSHFNYVYYTVSPGIYFHNNNTVGTGRVTINYDNGIGGVDTFKAYLAASTQPGHLSPPGMR